jgi:hypothetical protein
MSRLDDLTPADWALLLAAVFPNPPQRVPELLTGDRQRQIITLQRHQPRQALKLDQQAL